MKPDAVKDITNAVLRMLVTAAILWSVYDIGESRGRREALDQWPEWYRNGYENGWNAATRTQDNGGKTVEVKGLRVDIEKVCPK